MHSVSDETQPRPEIDKEFALKRASRAMLGTFTRTRVVGRPTTRTRHVTAIRERSGSSGVKTKLLAVVGCKCEACGTSMPDASMLHFHHVVPVRRGGETTTSNAALLCPNCHAKAHWLDRKLSPEQRPTCAADLLALLTRITRKA